MRTTCLLDGRAEAADAWTWKDGSQIVLGLAASEGKLAVRITYRQKAEERVRAIPSVDGL